MSNVNYMRNTYMHMRNTYMQQKEMAIKQRQIEQQYLDRQLGCLDQYFRPVRSVAIEEEKAVQSKPNKVLLLLKKGK